MICQSLAQIETQIFYFRKMLLHDYKQPSAGGSRSRIQSQGLDPLLNPRGRRRAKEGPQVQVGPNFDCTVEVSEMCHEVMSPLHQIPKKKSVTLHLVTVGKALLQCHYNEPGESMNLSCERYDLKTETEKETDRTLHWIKEANNRIVLILLLLLNFLKIVYYNQKKYLFWS